MIIGIDASRAFLAQRTGIEEYSYQVIKHLRRYLKENSVVLYIRPGQEVDFDLPEKWSVKTINRRRLWTQIGLSLEMKKNPVDVLFVPAHTVSLIHPKNTVVTIHGLEYEIFPKAYSWLERLYMRLSIRKSCAWAKKIISVSENTKKDLKNIYKVEGEKVAVVYEGYQKEAIISGCNFEKIKEKFQITEPFFIFVGRIEERKNIRKVVKAFTDFRKNSKIRYQLVLAGKGGYGYDKIGQEIGKSEFASDIIQTGFISNDEKSCLMDNGEAFVFTTLYEGFGIPLLEAQSHSLPVISSNLSSIPEVVRESALLVDPHSVVEIANAMNRIACEPRLREKLIQRGGENILRFSWDKCACQIAQILINQYEKKE